MEGRVSNCSCPPLLAEMGFPEHATSSFHTGRVLGKPGWVVTLCEIVDLTVNFSITLQSISSWNSECSWTSFIVQSGLAAVTLCSCLADSVNSWHSLSRKCLWNGFRLHLTPLQSLLCFCRLGQRVSWERRGTPPVPTSNLPPPSSAKVSSLLTCQEECFTAKLLNFSQVFF